MTIGKLLLVQKILIWSPLFVVVVSSSVDASKRFEVIEQDTTNLDHRPCRQIVLTPYTLRLVFSVWRVVSGCSKQKSE